MGAGVILPKRLLAAAMAAKDPSGYDHLLRDNYESPVYAPTLAVSDQQLHQMSEMLEGLSHRFCLLTQKASAVPTSFLSTLPGS